MNRFLCVPPLLLAALLVACGGRPGDAELPPAAKAESIKEFLIDSDLISESSGLARSQRDAELLWTHNDSGGKTQAYAVDTQGHYQGTLSLQPALNLDWEDMTSFTENGTPRLLLADVGDNGAFRPFLTLYIVEEPDVTGLARPFDLRVLPLRQIQLTYPDGPRDVESIGVDAAEGSIYIISKRDAQPQLYRIPLAPLVPVVVAENLGPINIPRAPADADNPESINWVTSMDIDDSGSILAALTLTRAYFYRRAEGESWQAALQRAPVALDIPDYSQIEACALSAAGDALYLTSEGSPAPLARLALPRELR